MLLLLLLLWGWQQHQQQAKEPAGRAADSNACPYISNGYTTDAAVTVAVAAAATAAAAVAAAAAAAAVHFKGDLSSECAHHSWQRFASRGP